MELTVPEAAALLGRSPRTLRAQVARGEIPGTKRNGRWYVDKRDLPLTEVQRRALQEKSDQVRAAVESVLPSRMASRPGQRFRSLADLDSFRRGAQLLAEISQSDHPAAMKSAFHIRKALFHLAEAVHQYHRDLKADALAQARAELAHAVAVLLMDGGLPPPDPLHGWVLALETEILPAVSGFARWVAQLSDRSR